MEVCKSSVTILLLWIIVHVSQECTANDLKYQTTEDSEIPFEFSYSQNHLGANKYSRELNKFTKHDWYRIRKILNKLPIEKTSLQPIYEIAKGNTTSLDELLEVFFNNAEQQLFNDLVEDADLRTDLFRDPLLEVISHISDEDENIDPDDIPGVEERNQTQGWEGCLRDYDMVMLPSTLDYERTLALRINDRLPPLLPKVPIPVAPPANPVARQIVDSNARRPAGLAQGAFHWVGAVELCFTIGVRYKWNGTGETRVFKGKYVRLSLPTVRREHVTHILKLSIGVCAPDTCSNEDIARYVGQENRAMIRMIVEGGIQPRNVTYVYSGQETDLRTDTNALIVFAICILLVIVVLVSTGYDGCVRTVMLRKKILDNAQARKGSKLTLAEIKDAESYLYGKPSLFDRLETSFAGFSLYSNLARIYRAERPPDHIRSLNGIRALAYMWLLNSVSFLYGVYIFQTWTTQNGLAALRTYLNEWSTMTIIAFYYSNAVFFYVSGFVCVHMFYKAFKDNGEKVTVWFSVSYLLRRFWSLFPTHAMALIIYTWTYRYLTDGPLMSPNVLDADNCKTNWWYALVMFNNLFDNENQCMPGTYYYCCLFQLGLASIFVLIPLVILPVAGYVMVALMYIAHIIAFGILETQTYDREKIWFFKVLQTPWCHAGPYVIGMIFAMIIHNADRKKKWHWALITLLWVCSAAGILIVIFTPWDYFKSIDRRWTREGNIIFDVLAPQIMGVSLGWITFACWKGYGGIAAKILEWGFFAPLGNMMMALSMFMGTALMNMFTRMVTIFYVHERHMTHVFYAQTINAFILGNIGSLFILYPLSKGVIAATRARNRLEGFMYGRHPDILDSLSEQATDIFDINESIDEYQSSKNVHESYMRPEIEKAPLSHNPSTPRDDVISGSTLRAREGKDAFEDLTRL